MFGFAYGFLLSRRVLPMIALLIASGSALWAQADGQTGPPPGEMRQRGPGIERELRQLTQVLTLTEEQQTQVKELLTARRQQMEALRKPSATNDATSETQQPTREQVEAIREATDTKISALLNDEQKAKFAAWQQQRKQMMERHRGQPDSQAPPANPPSA